MKRILGICLIFLILCGCGGKEDALTQAMQLRSELLEASGCSFNAKITADYGDLIYHFTLNCKMQANGELAFTVAEPETISGITGTISQTGGKILFEDKALFFEELSPSGISPVAAPWVMLQALKGGYIRGAMNTDYGVYVQLDDSYSEKALKLNLKLDQNNAPVFAELFYDGRRIMTIEIESFAIV